jgi:hypothetical protein
LSLGLGDLLQLSDIKDYMKWLLFIPVILMILSIAIMFDEYFFHQLFARYDSQQLQLNLAILSPIVSNSYHSNHHF